MDAQESLEPDVADDRQRQQRKGMGLVREAGTWKTKFLLSGVVTCAECGFPLTIYGSKSGRYYRCNTNYAKGTCKSQIAVREPELRATCLDSIRGRLQSKAAVRDREQELSGEHHLGERRRRRRLRLHLEGIEYVRRQMADRLKTWSRTIERDLAEHGERIKRNEDRIKGLVRFIADGDRSDYVVSTLRDLEVQVKADGAAVDRLERAARDPLQLPSLGEITRSVFDLDRLLARVKLRRWLRDGVIQVRPKHEGCDVRGSIDTLSIVAENANPVAMVAWGNHL